ncbi:MAG: class I mannose-6-phosphate isomerase [Bacteroidales bacterium]|nr:class I mannose-6-phosphate isomerase [Bacteroidales bacterium]MDT8432091.1 type I phosphomannose isomerase catalytic subunit [Bacteroidales bacterium]
MENTLYPLKFKPVYKDYIWGGQRLKTELGKENGPGILAESWEISGVKDNVTVVAEGFLAGNPLDELIEVYMGDLVGEKVFEKFGTEFPVLIKFIDAKEKLSVQVHPDDRYAAEHHGSRGKTEMWYVIDAEEGAELISGFSRNVDDKIFMEHLENKKLSEILNFEPVKAGDVFFLPAGRLHAIGNGIMLAEIQETSDVTYRIYDWDRVDAEGNGRELHLDHAVKVMDYKKREDIRTRYDRIENSTINLADCPHFTTSLIDLDKPVDKDFNLIDSFVVYICTEGKIMVNYKGGEAVSLQKGESMLVPADLKEISLLPEEKSTLLEVYMKI